MRTLLFTLCLSFSLLIQAQNKTTTMRIYDIPLTDIDGKAMDLSDYKGKKILFVNVASKCGFTPQYEELEKMSALYKDKLVVIGLPCNQFMSQEPGTNEEIKAFCSATYGVTFPMTDKVDVKGPNQHMIYKWLTNKALNGKSNTSVKWNFQKYLVDENGELLDHFYSITKPLSPKITKYL